MKKIISLLLVATLILFAIPNNSWATELTSVVPQMTIEEMLLLSLTDEIFAEAIYSEIINTYDPGVPFTWVVKVEANHIRFVASLYNHYGLSIPNIDISSELDVPATYEASLELAIEGEIHNVVTYGEFLTYDLEDEVLRVFHMLKKTSESHLKAFTRELISVQSVSN